MRQMCSLKGARSLRLCLLTSHVQSDGFMCSSCRLRCRSAQCFPMVTELALIGIAVIVLWRGKALAATGKLNAIAGTHYPTYLRSAGMGWFGRGANWSDCGPLFRRDTHGTEMASRPA